MLRAADVTFAYTPRAAPVVRGVSLDVPAGGFVGILGPNGSGKTTLLRLLAGTLQPSRGRVTLDGADLARVSRTALARRMAVVPQETQLAFDYTALEVVLMGRYPHLGAFEIEGPRDLAIAREALAATGTLALEDRLFATLSGGEKQRVVIAAALAQISAVGSSRSDWRSPIRSQRPGFCCSTSRRRRSTSAYQLEVAALLRRSAAAQRRVAIVVSTHDLNFAGRTVPHAGAARRTVGARGRADRRRS